MSSELIVAALLGAAVVIVLIALGWMAKQLYVRFRPIVLTADPLSSVAGEHNVQFVSRHHIAESGLVCPVCGNVTRKRADFSGIRRYRLTDGSASEGVVCKQDRFFPHNGTTRRCGAILLACPDTEHGDDLVPDNPEHYKFVRISQVQAIKEEHGDDAVAVDEQERVTVRPDPQRKNDADVYLQS